MLMKPPDGRCQSATKVNVLSLENFDVGEADSFHVLEGSMLHLANGKRCLVPRGLGQCYGIEWKRQELGRAYLISKGMSEPKREGYTIGRRQSDPFIVVTRSVKTGGAKGRMSKRSGEGKQCAARRGSA